MARNSERNTVHRVEFSNSTKRERERKQKIADADREASRPRMSAVTPETEAARAEADERLRLSTGIGKKGWLAVPKEKWDKMDLFEKEQMARVAQAARESGMAYAVPGAVIEAPGLTLTSAQRAAFGSGVPQKFTAGLNDALRHAYYSAGRYPPTMFGNVNVLNSPAVVADKLSRLREGGLNVGNLMKHKVFGINAVPWEDMTPLERELWLEGGHLPLSSLYFYRGKAAAPTGRFRAGTHWSRLSRGTPMPSGDLNLTVGSGEVSPELASHLTVGARSQTSSFTLVENPASGGPTLVRPKYDNGYFGRPLGGGQAGGFGNAWVHEDAKGGRSVRVAEGAGNSAVNRVDRVSAPYAAKAPEETFDTPIPESLRGKYEAWYAQLPKNLQYTGDYDLQGAWLEKLGRPDKYEATQTGHLDDYGKKPNHITFSTGSKWHDPKVPERTGGEWRQAKDGSWDFYPGTGNKASDDELKAYFEKYEKGNRVHKREVHQDALGGDAGSGTAVSGTPVSEAPQNPGGPRIVINPQVFKDKRDALCVAFNEAFRVVMETNGFDPVSEPTERQRKFFADTAYAGDETQLRRTILARIATLDTSVKDPTDEQLEETAEMLEMVMEVGAPQNEWEQQAVQRLHDVVAKARGAPERT